MVPARAAFFVIVALSLATVIVDGAFAEEYVWDQIDTTSAPSPRRSHAMAYDPEADAVVLFGGFGNGSHLGDTWTLKMTDYSWSRIETVQSPSPRAAATLVYDNANHQLLMFGGFGYGHSIVANDTWAFNT